MDTPPNNAFAAPFLETLGNTIEWPCTLTEGDYSGPWNVVSRGKTPDTKVDQWAVERLGDAEPFLITPHWETACMIAAVLPHFCRLPAYTSQEGKERGYSDLCMLWESGLSSVGRIRTSGEDTIAPLNLVHSLLVSPVSLAYVLIAAPADILQRTGMFMATILEERARNRNSPSPPDPEQK